MKNISQVLNVLYPSTCPVCLKPSDSYRISPLCSICWGKIERHDGGGCRICASVTDYNSTGVCQGCRTLNPVFERVIAYGIYDGVLKEVIHHMKFGQIRRLAGVLGRELSTLQIPNADLIIPVPLSVHGLRRREFNQSAIMARVLSKQTGIPLYLNCLRKVKETLPQSLLPKKERRSNVKGAFSANGKLADKMILLIDDVVTTAATINECAKALKKAGISSVTVMTAARARNE